MVLLQKQVLHIQALKDRDKQSKLKKGETKNVLEMIPKERLTPIVPIENLSLHFKKELSKVQEISNLKTFDKSAQ